MRVLRVSHSAVVDAWRERERLLRRDGLDVRTISARVWDEAGMPVRLVPRPGEPVEGVATIGRHPALFLFDPRPLWRALGERWDVIDLHEEPFALATAEVLLLRVGGARHTDSWRAGHPRTGLCPKGVRGVGASVGGWGGMGGGASAGVAGGG